MDKTTHDAAPKETPTEARQGETSGHMRWVLLVSIALAVIVMGVAAFGFRYH